MAKVVRAPETHGRRRAGIGAAIPLFCLAKRDRLDGKGESPSRDLLPPLDDRKHTATKSEWNYQWNRKSQLGPDGEERPAS